ncbi:MAG: tetratricopeptide repeat protein [Nitrospinota bacterium]
MNRLKISASLVAIIGTLLFLNNHFLQTETWENYNKKGMAAFGKGNFKEAESNFLKALELCKSSPLNSGEPRLYFSLNQLAELYRIHSKFKKAESILLRLLEMDKNQLGPTHPNIAFGLNNLAGIYRSQGRLKEAEVLLKQAIEIIETSFNKDHPLVENLNEHYAHLLHQMGRHSEAENLTYRFP